MTTSPCHCSDCEEVRGVNLAKIKPVVAPIENQRTPKGLKDIRKAVTAFYNNPEKFLDFSTLVFDAYNNVYTISGKSFEDATGLEKLGRGHYSDVYAIDDNRVLKIVKKGDSGYARYVALIRANPGNPYFPKVHYSGTWGGKTVYVLERLDAEPINGNQYDLHREFSQALKGHSGRFVEVRDKKLLEAGRLLRENNLLSDFHSSNMMWRGDVPVISDPASD